MNNKTIGDRIKFHRKRLGMTQEQLAERMGVSAQAVSKWENNLSCPDISVLPELAEIFGITVDELLGKNPPAGATVHEAEVVNPEKEKHGSSVSWEWDNGGMSVKLGSVFFALYILVVGGLMLMNHLCGFDVSWWTVVWTSALVFIGATSQSRHFSLFGLVMSLAGLYFLLSAYGVIRVELGWGVVFPVVLLLWGVSLLIDIVFGKRRRHGKSKTTVHNNKKLHHEYSCDNGYLHCELSFGEYRAAVVTPMLKGGSIDSSFGDFTVDFSACESLAPNCRIDVDNSFGELTLLVPDKFRAEVNRDGGFAANSEIKGAPAAETRGVLFLEVDNSFGNVVLRYV